jgi:hypothetical protein
VGIRRTPTEATFEIEGSTISRGDVNGYVLFAPKVGTTAFGTNYDRFEIRVDSGNQKTIIGNTNGGTGVARSLVFLAGNGEHMTISPNGHVTKPNQPLFSASHSLALDLTDAVLTTANCFNSIDYNVGNCFNGATGRFTAPVAGYYDCSVHAADGGAGASVNLRIRKNGVGNVGPLAELYNQIATPGSTNNMVRCIVFLAVGDYIDYQVARFLTVAAIQHKRFIIHLIG